MIGSWTYLMWFGLSDDPCEASTDLVNDIARLDEWYHFVLIYLFLHSDVDRVMGWDVLTRPLASETITQKRAISTFLRLACSSMS